MEHIFNLADYQSTEISNCSDFSTRGLNSKLPKVVSLFSGAGGLDLGFKEQGFEIPIAFDISPAAIKTHNRNFPNTNGLIADLTKIGPQGVCEKVMQLIPAGERIGLIGGPPCQGFSRANSGAKANDPRNKFPALYIKIVEKIAKYYCVEFVVFENVIGMKDKKHLDIYNSVIEGLGALNFDVTEKQLYAPDYGVPQNRKRIILFAMRSGQGYSVAKPRRQKGMLNVKDAIHGLVEPAIFERNLDKRTIPMHENHWTMKPRSEKFRNPNLIKKNSRSFRRLQWDSPSATIAFGNREIHVHPNGHRRLSIFEAMLLQGFTQDFVFEGNLSEQVQQVSNAVPPPLARSVARAVQRALAGM